MRRSKRKYINYMNASNPHFISWLSEHTGRIHGHEMTITELSGKFIPYFRKGQRITVSFCDKDGKEYERKRGTVGITTGWKPVFLLMLTKRSHGSSWTLSDKDKIIV